VTYGELKQAVQDYLETSETAFVSSIPLFVETVENRVYNEVQIPALRKNVTGQMTAGSRYIVVPEDFLSVFSTAIIDPDTGEYSYLLFKDVNYIREVYPSPNTLGPPRVYGLFDTTSFILGPSPDKSYEVELHYFYYPTSLVEAGESWLSKNFSAVMLYGVIAEGYRFQKGDEKQQAVYDAQFNRALGLLGKLGEQKSRDDAFSTTVSNHTTKVGE
jgi:hypothetical protein